MKGAIHTTKDSHDDVDGEILPLTTSQLIQQRSTSFSETMGILFYDDPIERGGQPSRGRNIREFLFGILLFAVGCWGPKYILLPYIFGTTTIKNEPPFQTTKAGDIILDFQLNQPLVEPATIPSSLLIATSVWLPLCLVLMVEVLGQSPKRPAYALAGLLTSIGISEGMTQTIKLMVQRPRPNYYALCGFDTTALTKTCTADASRVREAQSSFPSGHSSLSACSAIWLICYILSKVIVSPRRKWSVGKKRITSAMVVTILGGWMIFVGVSRLVDQWHFVSDVLAGWMLGSVVATTVFHLYYYPLWHSQVGVPLC